MLPRSYHRNFLKSSPVLVFGVLLSGACGSPSQGSEGQACYKNNTCDEGLVCLSDLCVDPVGGKESGGSSNGAGGKGAGAGGKSSGAGGGIGVDLDACFSCGEDKCPDEKKACDDQSGCAEIFDCSIGCAGDAACASKCSVTGLSQDDLVKAAQLVGSYASCTVTACTSECSVNVGSGGGSGIGGGASVGGRSGDSGGANSSGGRSSGGNSSGGSSNDTSVVLFDGEGAGVGNTDLGIVGGFYILEDSVKEGVAVEDKLTHTDLDAIDSAVEPSTLEGSAAPCIDGEVAVVTDADGYSCETTDASCDWAAIWGGGIGLSLNETDMVPMAWDASAHDITGFRFKISGSTDGVPVRFLVEDMDGNQFCVNKVGTGTVDVPFSSLQHECWSPTSMSLDLASIKSISWQFVPDASRSYAISNFCVDALALLK